MRRANALKFVRDGRRSPWHVNVDFPTIVRNSTNTANCLRIFFAANIRPSVNDLSQKCHANADCYRSSMLQSTVTDGSPYLQSTKRRTPNWPSRHAPTKKSLSSISRGVTVTCECALNPRSMTSFNRVFLRIWNMLLRSTQSPDGAPIP